MSEATAASSYGAQPSTAPINLVNDSMNTQSEPAPHEEAWGLDNGVPGETIEVADGDEEFNPGIELDETARFKPKNKEKETANTQGKEQQLSAEQELTKLKEEQKNFKKGIYEKFQEVSEMRKQLLQEKQQLTYIAQQLKENAVKNPLKVFEAAGVTPEQRLQVLETAAMQLQQELQKTPEQRRLEQLEEYHKQTTEREQQQVEAYRQQQEETQVQQLQDGLSTFIIDAFNKRVGLPATPERVRQMAMSLSDYYEAGRPVDIERVADEAWEGFRSDVQRSLQKSPAEKLIEIVGEDNAKRIAAQLGQKFAVNQHFKNHSKPKQPSAPNHEGRSEYLGMADVEEMRRKGQI